MTNITSLYAKKQPHTITPVKCSSCGYSAKRHNLPVGVGVGNGICPECKLMRLQREVEWMAPKGEHVHECITCGNRSFTLLSIGVTCNACASTREWEDLFASRVPAEENGGATQ